MRSSPEKGDTEKYYRYHRDHGHDTEECRQLKNQIEDLIHKWHLRKYVDRNAHQQRREHREEAPPQQEKQQNQPIGIIHTIFGGVASSGDHKNVRKAYGRQSLAVQQIQHSKRIRTGGDEEAICFSEVDYEGVRLPHDDPVVVTLLVELFTMKRILIDSGSSADILYGPQTQVQVTLLVVDTPILYNAIIGRPCLNLLEVIVSKRHLVMKFPTRFGVGEVRGDQ
ncbi:LOW QUALITY PROTEIN: hypothetical protein CFOL_v3_16073, partial [Cephalotus follicularis]